MRYRSIVPYLFPVFLLSIVSCSIPEKPVTKEEATTWSKELEAAMANRNAGKFNQVIDIEAFENRIIEQGHHKLDQRMVTGALKSIRSGELGSQVVQALGEKGTYELVKQYEKDNHQHLVFRLYNDQLNYHDFELIKKANQVKASDIFIYTTGEKLSTTLTESLLSMSNQDDMKDVKIQQELSKIQRIKSYINSKEPKKAEQLFKTLPAIIRDQKIYKLLYVQICSGIDTDQYLAALNKFHQEYPDAPNMYLLMIDAYWLKNDFDGALKCVNQLDSLINKDPFLDYYRGLIYKQKGDTATERQYLEKLNTNMPQFAQGLLELIYYYVVHGQADKAVPLMKRYKQHKYVDNATLENIYSVYPAFKKKVEAAGY